MLKKKKPVLDEREMQEMYRIEHTGLWLMFALLCAAVFVQLLAGAKLVQMAGELFALVAVSCVMIVANVRQGIWDESTRPSTRGNAMCALGVGVCVAAVTGVIRTSAAVGLLFGAAACVSCFVLLMGLMAYMKRRQEQCEQALENDE